MSDPIGVSSPSIIPDSFFRASTSVPTLTGYFHPAHARLDDYSGGGWCALKDDDTPNDWLQIDFGKTIEVCGVATQGDINGNEWVTEFQLSFSSRGDSWKTYKDTNGVDMVRFRCFFRHWKIQYIGKFLIFSVLRPENHKLLKFETIAWES